jgi:hypothetical protein
MKRLLLLLCLAACMPLWGGVLWNQPVNWSSSAYVNQEFPDVPTYSTYVVSDIVVPAGGWTVTSGTWYGGCWNGGCGYGLPTIPVLLNVFPLSGSLPGAGDDPTAGTPYTASISISGGSGDWVTIQLTGLSLVLPAGSYWIGITPELSFGSVGQLGFRETTGAQGYLDAIRNPGGDFGYGGDWMAVNSTFPGATTDAAFMLEGTAGAIPEPSTWVLGVTGMAILAWFRRKR